MRRERRLVAQLLLLPALYLASLPDPAAFATLISMAVVVAPAVNLTVAGILVWTARQAPGIETLAERADDAVTLALMSVGAAAAGFLTLARNLGFEFPGRPTIAMLAWVLVLISVPALGWLRTWRTRWLPAVHPPEVPPAA
jgi:hypothetical protein